MPRMRSFPRCQLPDPEGSRLELRESVVISENYVCVSEYPQCRYNLMGGIKSQWPATNDANIVTRETLISNGWKF
jgi:hypothetical protein